MLSMAKKIIVQREGQALVEFALLLPVLVIILFAITEFGRLWMTVNVLSGAAREGVRVAAVTAPDPGATETAVNNILNAANIQGATVTLSGPNAASEVTVTVQMSYTVITGAVVPGLNGTIQLTRSATMHWEG